MVMTAKKQMTPKEVEKLFLLNAKSFLSVKTQEEELSGKGTLKYHSEKSTQPQHIAL